MQRVAEVGRHNVSDAVYFSPPQLSSPDWYQAICTAHLQQVQCVGWDTFRQTPAAGGTQKFQSRVAEPCLLNTGPTRINQANGVAEPFWPAQVHYCLPGHWTWHGQLIQHCSKVLDSLENCWTRAGYKIGLTGKTPEARWEHAEYGYQDQSEYQGMLVLAMLPSFVEGALLEAALIDKYINCPGCENRQLGGQGHRTEGDHAHWIYVVHKSI
jgi:hypothetical protein